MSITRFKLVFFSPKESTSKILDHLFRACPKTLGNIGEYERCAFVTRGTGQFMPKQTANPTIGSAGQLEFVEEDRVEVLVSDATSTREEVKQAIKELKNIHPYEEVAYDVYKLEDLRRHRFILCSAHTY
ncbi:GTP cyclohydrolase 1 type 2-like protein [Psilocybe cubensis]|uniref:ATP phosphoribosyltransferase n=2 Tax=Psilocybe cubensis TaxID=181762 RepID=A0A8H7Y8X0_PSICU|nr:GTP cyclohydrolase 1 type 2-like protein [Psilocybe cubensis]KAH9485632.1 GTP cyclohydrolase 1 type 2-like protein [Psilocybe cubensis]